MRTVYLDVYFLLNFWMDICLICMTGAVCSEKIRLLRIAFAGCVGAAFSCILLALNMRNLWSIWDVAAAFVMLRICWPHYKNIKILGRTGIFLTVSFLQNGVMNWWYFDVLMTEKLTSGILAGGSLTAAVIFCFICCLMKKKREKEKNVYRVLLYFDDMKVIADGLLDSGNVLRDMAGKPVHILETDVLKDTDNAEGLRKKVMNEGVLQEYRCIGGEGKMTVVMADRMLVPELKADMRLVPIALTHERLFSDGRCHMLLNSALKN